MSEQRALSGEHRAWLLGLARRTVREALDGRGLVLPDPAEVPDPLHRPGAAFVTLRREGRLLGCIGSLEPRRALAVDVAVHAYDAAFRDPRLPAVTHEDWVRMHVEISVLDAMEPMAVSSVDELLVELRPGVDGLWIESREGRATFLPSVWEQVRSAREFRELLWRKAGLPRDRWPTDLEVSRYGVEEFGESAEAHLDRSAR